MTENQQPPPVHVQLRFAAMVVEDLQESLLKLYPEMTPDQVVDESQLILDLAIQSITIVRPRGDEEPEWIRGMVTLAHGITGAYLQRYGPSPDLEVTLGPMAPRDAQGRYLVPGTYHDGERYVAPGDSDWSKEDFERITGQAVPDELLAQILSRARGDA